MAGVVTAASAAVVEEPGFFTNAWNWISDTAVKVWEAVKGFFASIGEFIAEHQEGFIWGAAALVTGGLIVALFWFINGCCKSDEDPITAKDMLAQVKQLHADAKSEEAQTHYAEMVEQLSAAMTTHTEAVKALAEFKPVDDASEEENSATKDSLVQAKLQASRALTLIMVTMPKLLEYIETDYAEAEAAAAKDALEV